MQKALIHFWHSAHGPQEVFLPHIFHSIITHDIKINGISAEVKMAKGANNLANYAKKATTKQGANLVVFQIDESSRDVYFELSKLSKKGIHGFYYFTGKTSALKSF